jgi:hypothetical protein
LIGFNEAWVALSSAFRETGLKISNQAGVERTQQTASMNSESLDSSLEALISSEYTQEDLALAENELREEIAAVANEEISAEPLDSELVDQVFDEAGDSLAPKTRTSYQGYVRGTSCKTP